MRLYELNLKVRQLVEGGFSETYWVTAELSDVRMSGGHCFMEFIEKSPFSNDMIAKARGQIWSSTYKSLSLKFEKATGQPLSDGMQVMVNVRVTFSEKYGYSLNVVDIDPTYTLGDIAKRRKEIIDQLKADGVYSLNKELDLPVVLNRIAVISSATAAGYQDFCHQLEHNVYNLQFTTRLFPAVMQGSSVESSVIAALDLIYDEHEKWDAVVIIRGGGSTTDLSGFDSYLLGLNVAQFALPVITGIGHERDTTVIDEVSHTRVKTPTAAAEFLINHQYEVLSHLLELEDEILDYCRRTVTDEHRRIQMLTDKLPSLFKICKEREYHKLDTSLSSAVDAIRRIKLSQVGKLEMTDSRLNFAVNKILDTNKHKLSMATSKISGASPERLLKLGYSITRVNGKSLSDIHQLKAGMEIMTTLSNGSFSSTVNRAKPKEPVPPVHLVPPGYNDKLA